MHFQDRSAPFPSGLTSISHPDTSLGSATLPKLNGRSLAKIGPAGEKKTTQL